MKTFSKTLCCLLSLVLLSGAVYTSGIYSFAAQPEFEILEIDDSNPFDYEHFVNEPEKEKSRGGIEISPSEETNTKAADLPSSYDSRDYGYVSPVKNQGATGTCWAHATMSALESYELIYNRENAENINLSESHLTWFSLNPNSNGANKALDGENLGTGAYSNGGNWRYAALALANREGLNKESDYPLMISGSNMTYSESDRYSQTAGITAEDAVYLSNTDKDGIKSAIMNNGSVTCSICYNNLYLTSIYSSGSRKASYYCPDTSQTNHAVTLVGWDDNYSKSNFISKVPSGNGAWIAKNSYGSSWGNNGYFMISYEDASISQFVSWSAMDTSEFTNNYSHTSALFKTTITGFNTYASVYTAEGNEMIDNIGIFNLMPDASVTVSVYRNLPADGNPVSGNLAGSQKRYLTNDGYYTFYFGNIPLNKGERFAVVVTSACSGDKLIPVESESIGSFTCNAGESYIKTGNSWFDLTDNTEYAFGNTYVFVNTKCRHSYDSRETPATCITSGKSETYCQYCNLIVSESVIPATGHHFNTVSSSESDSNKIVYTEVCEHCGVIQTESYIKGSRTITFAQLIQQIFEMFFGRLRGVKAGDKY